MNANEELYKVLLDITQANVFSLLLLLLAGATLFMGVLTSAIAPRGKRRWTTILVALGLSVALAVPGIITGQKAAKEDKNADVAIASYLETEHDLEIVELVPSGRHDYSGLAVNDSGVIFEVSLSWETEEDFKNSDVREGSKPVTVIVTEEADGSYK